MFMMSWLQAAIFVDMEMKGLFSEENSGSLACCPLRRSGDTYSFLHKSLQECFAALHMARQIAQWQLGGEPPADSLSIEEKFLTDDVAVLKFLAQFVDQRVWRYRRQSQDPVDADNALQPLGRGLWDLLYQSRQLSGLAQLTEANKRVVRGAANALSVLAAAGVSFCGSCEPDTARESLHAERNMRDVVTGHECLGTKELPAAGDVTDC